MTTTKTTKTKKTAAKKKASTPRGLPENLKKAIAKRKAPASPSAEAPAHLSAQAEQELTLVTLTRITPNPLNPRKNFSGPPFEELVDSVRAKGVISPIMVRPHGKAGDFEIVYGERRWRAACRIAKENGGLAKHTIPALVRRIDENEAFDLMTIENLKRQDLTELEEAMSFKQYVDRNGQEAVGTLAERTGIQASYIRRRLMVMVLPEHILQEWNKGLLKFGHLEQLARMGDNQERIELLFGRVMEYAKYNNVMTVERLKSLIASNSPGMEFALFDPAVEGCLSCHHNSDVQKNLFALDSEDIRCNKPECFLQKKTAWLEANWKEFRRKKKATTNGFRFHEALEPGKYRLIQDWQKRGDKCKECDHFLSVVYLDSTKADNACFGEEKCYDAEINGKGKKDVNTKSAGQDPDKSAGVVDTAPRVAWHGGYFRDLFFQAQLPVKVAAVEAGDLRLQRMALFGFVKNTRHLHGWFALKSALRPESKIDSWTCLGDEEIFEFVRKLDAGQVAEFMKEAAVVAVLEDKEATKARKFFADHIGIDVTREWSITEEYLQKKVKAEILSFIEEHKLGEIKEFANYLSNTLNCLPGEINKLKKGELVDALLKSGIDLVGKVPAEIINAD